MMDALRVEIISLKARYETALICNSQKHWMFEARILRAQIDALEKALSEEEARVIKWK